MSNWASLSNESRLIVTSAGLVASLMLFRPTRRLFSLALLGRRKPSSELSRRNSLQVPELINPETPESLEAIGLQPEVQPKSNQTQEKEVEVDDLFYTILRQYRGEQTPSKVRHSEGRSRRKHSHQRHSLNN